MLHGDLSFDAAHAVDAGEMVHLKFPARLVRVYFSLHVVRNPIAKFFSVYALTDEAYAVTAAEPKGWTSWRLLALQISFQTYWVGGGILGVLLAGVIPGKIEGLEFALYAGLKNKFHRYYLPVPALLLLLS